MEREPIINVALSPTSRELMLNELTAFTLPTHLPVCFLETSSPPANLLELTQFLSCTTCLSRSLKIFFESCQNLEGLDLPLGYLGLWEIPEIYIFQRLTHSTDFAIPII
ncbi:hypothetical protein J6590_031927 [Homalodisca vitripennis]|nr:hypothetical protein J6590_031927 [Homalodisca vitripennis]